MDQFTDLSGHLDRLGVAYVRHPSALQVAATDAAGFEVAMTDAGAELIVSFGALWHDHFEDRKAAVEHFLFGLTPGYRLIERCRGRRVVEAALEVEGPRSWRRLSTVATAARLLPWPPLHTRARHNTHLSPDTVATELGLAPP